MNTGTNGVPQFAVPTAEGVNDALEAIQAACKARKWMLIAPDGRVWQNENPMLISAALLAELGGYMQPLGGDFARILDENRWALYGDSEEKLNEAIERMDRARNILTGGAPTPERNWGMLDTADLRPNAKSERPARLFAQVRVE